MESRVREDQRKRAYETALLAAARCEFVGDYWGKGVAESHAAAALLPTGPYAPRDSRIVTLHRRSAASFERVPRYADEAASRMGIAMELTIRGRPNWIRHGLFALSRYESGRGSSLIPFLRRDRDRLIARGLQLLTSHAMRVADRRGSDGDWRGLVWR